MPRHRFVVTEGAGFLGNHLCERLLTDGAEVPALDVVTGAARFVTLPQLRSLGSRS